MQNYEKIRKLGQGSFGSVFLMRDIRDQVLCVMKAIDMQALDAKGKQEALREVGFLSKLNHPCIIAYRDYFQETLASVRGRPAQNMLYIVMEYADGGDLSSRIRTQGSRYFAEHQVMSWLVQTCLALKHMHDRHVIHRDIKSENIFLTTTNMVKVGDFGISRHLANTMANARTRIGTPYYLSPEICMDKPYNTQTDMWALGVLLYEMLMLQHPFDASSMEQLLTKICRGRHSPVSRRWNRHLRAIVDLLLSKDPNDRPSVNQLLQNQLLQPFVKQFIEAQPPEIASRLAKSYRYQGASARFRQQPQIQHSQPHSHHQQHQHHQQHPHHQQHQQQQQIMAQAGVQRNKSVANARKAHGRPQQQKQQQQYAVQRSGRPGVSDTTSAKSVKSRRGSRGSLHDEDQDQPRQRAGYPGGKGVKHHDRESPTPHGMIQRRAGQHIMKKNAQQHLLKKNAQQRNNYRANGHSPYGVTPGIKGPKGPKGVAPRAMGIQGHAPARMNMHGGGLNNHLGGMGIQGAPVKSIQRSGVPMQRRANYPPGRSKHNNRYPMPARGLRAR